MDNDRDDDLCCRHRFPWNRRYPWNLSLIHISKICSCCGKLKKELKLEDRIYSCTCGNQMNRDENAAINICREGLRISGVELETERKIS